MAEPLVNELRETLAAARSQLEYLRDLGVERLNTPSAAAEQNQAARVDVPAPSESLEAIREDLGDCQRCGLAASRTRLVYGIGNPDARLVLVGEAPGREEDLRGEPFVGEAGRLLDRILAAMGLKRGDVYICNVLKCRPPKNRDPLPEEVATCEPFLIRQIAAIRPQVIVGLGRFAVHSLLKTRVPISQLRGEWRDYHGIPMMPTYHPAYLLRNPESKREVWEDMKAVLRVLNAGDQG